MDDERTEEPAQDRAATAGGVPQLGPTGEDGPRAQLERAVVSALEEVVVAQGPLTVEELAAQLADARPELVADLVADRAGEDVVERLTALALQADELWRLPDGRLAPVLHHLRRATFTHRLTAGEIEREAVDLSPDLIVLALPRAVALADGTALRTVEPGDDQRVASEASLLGPTGWLAPYADGDVLAMRYDGEHVHLERSTPSTFDEAAGRRAAEALAQAFAAQPGRRAPEVHRLVVDAIGTDPTSFTVPVEPVSELLESAGIEVHEAWAGTAGQPWSTPAEEARRRRVDELLAGADTCCRRAARRALDAWHDWLRASESAGPAPAPEAIDAARIAEDIDHGPAAAVLAEVATIGRPLVAVRRLGDWATAVSPGNDTAGAAYLRALGADAAADASQAETHLQAGLALAPGHPACLGFLAELVQDRGDAPRAIELLRQAGRPPGPDLQRELEPFVPSRPPGRNEPCPCGSGRKFKACCAGRPIRRPLVDRSRWLLAKASRHAARTDSLTLQSLRHLFEGAGAADVGGLVNDMLLFACRGLERYLDVRGALLPADELACATGWVGQPMRLLETVYGADAGGSTASTDLRSGDRLIVAPGAAATGVGPGDAGLTRVLPVDDVWLPSTVWLPIPAASRQRALDLLDAEVRPFHVLHLLVDLQVDALRP